MYAYKSNQCLLPGCSYLKCIYVLGEICFALLAFVDYLSKYGTGEIVQ